MAGSRDQTESGDAAERTPLLPGGSAHTEAPAPTNPPSTSVPTPPSAPPSSTNKEPADVPSPKPQEPPHDASPAPGRDAPTELDMGSAWGAPTGNPPRTPNDENLVIFRRAVGINDVLAGGDSAFSNVEEGHKTASGLYKTVIKERRTKSIYFTVLNSLIYAAHVLQILVGAALTALGPQAGNYVVAITSLGALNTFIAGVLALMKGQGLPERLHKDAVEFRLLQDWIEETDALLAAGVIGSDRREVGQLVELTFKKYNAVLANKENSNPENYVRQRPEGGQDREIHGVPGAPPASGESGASDNALARLNVAGAL